MNKTKMTIVIAVTLTSLLGGCASQETTETGFGNAVREVIMNQTYDIGATLESEPEAVVGADPYQLENVINAHRERSANTGQTGQATVSKPGHRW